MIKLPKCINLHIEFNAHAALYQTLEEWIEINDITEWVSTYEHQEALKNGTVWTCQWYPETPIGFHLLAASSFEALMKAVEATLPVEQSGG